MKVALVTGPDPGHLVPIAGLAALLIAAGHEAVVVTSDRWRAPLERDGIGWLSLPLIAAVAANDDVGYRLHVRPVEMTPPLVASLRGLALDVVVSDTLTRVGMIAAGVLGVPCVELIPHPLPDPSVALPPFGTGWEPRPRRDRRYAVRNAASRAMGEQQKRAALAAAGLPDVRPVHRLVTTVPSLEPPRPDWPADTTVVAPPTWEPADVDLAPPPGDGPLVLVVGTTASAGRPVDLLGAVRAAGSWRLVSPRFDDAPAVAADPVATGPGRLAPLLAAADVVVAPGGHGMVAASLRAGVPLVLVPGPGDQKEIAARVARVGAGVRVDKPRPGLLRRGIAAMLDPAPRAAAARAGDVTGLPDAVAILEAAAR